MKITGNTILITGGGSGIGKALAESLHQKGNKVIIAGRRADALEAVVQANPGMEYRILDIADGASIPAFAAELTASFPELNVVLNNAGIMVPETVVEAPGYLDTAEQTIAINLLGPIRLTAALLPHLQAKPSATVLTVSSGLAFVPLSLTPTYSATKAAIHSYSQSLRQQLKDTSVDVVEIAPPYVQTELMGAGQASDPRAMPLADFIAEVMQILESGPVDEVIVERCKPLRFARENGKEAEMFEMLNGMH
jgi:uncharacterized oxidoreductase